MVHRGWFLYLFCFCFLIPSYSERWQRSVKEQEEAEVLQWCMFPRNVSVVEKRGLHWALQWYYREADPSFPVSTASQLSSGKKKKYSPLLLQTTPNRVCLNHPSQMQDTPIEQRSVGEGKAFQSRVIQWVSS